jgi:putative addiction module antidote
MVQKIIQVGNSAAITLSKQYLKTMGLSAGDQVETEFYPETKKIVISLPETKKETINDRQLVERLGQLKKRYGSLYRKLAQAE